MPTNDCTGNLSIKDFVNEHYIDKSFTICPPEKPNSHWHWAPSACVKEGEPACQLSSILHSIKIQKQLLDITTDVICVANLNGWCDAFFYIKLPQEIVDAVNAMPETYYTFHGYVKPSKALMHFSEGVYTPFKAVGGGSSKKECINNNLQKVIDRFDMEDALDFATCRFIEQYNFERDVKSSDKPAIKHIAELLYDYVNKQHIFKKVRDLLFTASDLWYADLEEQERQKQERIAREKAEKEARLQSYIDWVEADHPTYYRYGFTYKGAKARSLDKDEAVDIIKKEKVYEYKWETINNEEALVLQDYGENDWW